jgi:hypothetical protein
MADVISDDLSEEAEDFDHPITVERIARIDGVLARGQAGGKTYSMVEVWEHRDETRAEWIRNTGQ